MRRLYLWLILLVSCPVAALGVERFPPPDFTSGYQLKIPTTPPARSDIFAYIDISILTLALGLAAYLVIWRRSRRGIVLLTIFSLLYFGFYRHGCICPIGAIQNTALAISSPGYSLPLIAAVFLLLPLIFALFFGRVFCAAVCPLGAAQDVVLRKPLNVPSWLAQPLSLIPWIYLGAAILFASTGTAFIICKYDPFVSFFRLSGSTLMLSVGAGMLGISVFVGRPYCRFLCPYGALLRLVSPFAKWRITITPDKCIQCRLCEKSCPFGEIRIPTPEDSSTNRKEGKRRLIIWLALLPVLIGIGAASGRLGGMGLARANYDVKLASQLWHKEQKSPGVPTDQITAFQKTGKPNAIAYEKALSIQHEFKTGGMLLGGWIGLVIAIKMIMLSIRRRRADYEADAAGCVGCGRCYSSCPVEQSRFEDLESIKLLEEKL
ncbi:MAG: 4Fe-4S binding protein [Armatimonadota bacterium]